MSKLQPGADREENSLFPGREKDAVLRYQLLSSLSSEGA